MTGSRVPSTLSLARAAFRPTEFWHRVRTGAAGRASVAVLVLVVAATLHIEASVARIVAMLAKPLPAATMSGTHRLAEISLAIAAPASRFSGAELWNVSRNAGPTEFRGREAVLAFGGATLLIAASPWRGTVVIDRHPAANWDSQRVELTPSLDPLLAPPVLLMLIGSFAAAAAIGAHAQARTARTVPWWMRTALMAPVLPPFFFLALACSAVAPVVGLPAFAAGAVFTGWLWLRPIDRAAA